jgi:antitoxin ParD1/3/4
MKPPLNQNGAKEWVSGTDGPETWITKIVIFCYPCYVGKNNIAMNVSLTPELEKFVEKEVNSGLYQTASEVVRAGLRRLKAERELRLARLPATLEELETQLLQSVEALDAGKGVPSDEALRRLRKRMRGQRAKA